MISLVSLAIALFAAKKVAAVGSPFGFATGTTGGNSAAQAIPTSAAQLKSWEILVEKCASRGLAHPIPSSFSTQEVGVDPALPLLLHTRKLPPPASASNLTKLLSAKAVPDGCKCLFSLCVINFLIRVSSISKGKGLRLNNVSNVIIQNIRISDLNPQYVWGGDALYIDNSSKIWVDHNYFKNVGRQFIVTGFGAAKQVTISNNYFDGQSTWSTGCDQHHYWALLFAGNGDQITFARNYMYFTAGRGPHIGGTDGYTLTLHMYNNYFNDITGHAIDADTGSKILIEGNYFNKVRTPSTGSTKGAAFAPISASMNSQCSATLGRNCVSNTLAGGSGQLTNTANNGILSSFTASTVKSASIMDPASVPSFVTSNAGLGKVN
ncbi:hypothetical protein RSOLAG1IB_10259 [Rhizoctonia solani AG-1 IB]|uniref:pectin lyase n=1 Tax=Thanatephorus cucumeris (strain AG1-IB / isolate 7/3/14) TaxID=1108050 RepID=A0A0B7FZ93_THACB|nr:hypothetical protein RSOLAG1IB_10259 [Rhizoctonia solani AG-1 IB]